MKNLIKLLSVLILVFVFLQSFINMSILKTEEQKYSIVSKYDDFEIRFYPSAVVASVELDGNRYKEVSSPGFRKLAGYIFGGNKENKKIAMTTPVQMDINDNQSTMTFVMPSIYSKENLPMPNDPNIKLSNTEDQYVAAIRFSGYTSDSEIAKYSDKLKNLLIENNIKTTGNFKFLGYNSPYQFLGRRNEIIVKVDWKNEPKP